MAPPDTSPSERVWLDAVMRLAEANAEAQERQTDRLVEAFAGESQANRDAIADGLAEVRTSLNRNSIGVVLVALVGFAALVAMSAGTGLDFAVGPSGLVVGAEAAIPETEQP